MLKIFRNHFIVSVLILLHVLSCSSRPKSKSSDHSQGGASVQSHVRLFQLFANIEKLGQFSEGDLTKALGTAWASIDESNRPYFFLYKAQVDSGPNKDLLGLVEARIPDVQGKDRILNLNFRSGVELTLESIEANYKNVQFTPANPNAPKSVPDMLIVQRNWGKIIFGMSRDGAPVSRSTSFQVDGP